MEFAECPARGQSNEKHNPEMRTMALGFSMERWLSIETTPVRPNPAPSQARAALVRGWTIGALVARATSNGLADVLPLIGVAATKTANDRKTRYTMPLHGCAADRTRRRALFTG